MRVVRPEGNNDLVWKHPSAAVPLSAQVVVGPDEWAVVVSEGRPAGTLGPGRHTLRSEDIPFLAGLVDEDGSSGPVAPRLDPTGPAWCKLLRRAPTPRARVVPRRL